MMVEVVRWSDGVVKSLDTCITTYMQFASEMQSHKCHYIFALESCKSWVIGKNEDILE